MVAICIIGSAQGKKRKRQDSPVEDVQDLIATEKNGRDFVGERTNAAGKLKVKTSSEDKEEMNTEATRECQSLSYLAINLRFYRN